MFSYLVSPATPTISMSILVPGLLPIAHVPAHGIGAAEIAPREFLVHNPHFGRAVVVFEP